MSGHIGHWSPTHLPGGGGCLPTSRVEMLLNYIARTDGKVNKFDETTIMGISEDWTLPVPLRITIQFFSNDRN